MANKIHKCIECLIWLLIIVGFGFTVYRTNFSFGIIYTHIMGVLWVLLVFSKDDNITWRIFK